MDEDDLIVQFVNITGASTSDAAQYLEMTEGDMQKAVDLYLDMGGMGVSNTGPRNETSSSYTQSLFEDNVREAIPSRYDQLIGGPSHPYGSMQGWLHQEPAIPSLAELEAQAVQDEFEEAGLGHLYRPPDDINSTGTFSDTMKNAKDSRKWLLVNIQAADEFQSHILNRDIWSHETVKEIIRSSFIFWQRDRSSAQGTQFVNNYRIEEFPVVCIIDPRTGRKVKLWKADKFRGPLTAADILADFMGENPYGTNISSPRASPTDSVAVLTRKGSVDSVDVSGLQSPAPPKIARVEESPLSMPSEWLANSGDADEVKIAVRLSNGQKKQVSFKQTAPLSAIKEWISSVENLKPSSFEVRLSHPPKSLDLNSGQLLQDSDLKGALLVVALLNVE